MADQSVALDVKTLPLQAPISPLAPLTEAQTYQTGQTQQQAAQTQLQMLNRQNSGQDITFRNQLIANAAAHALDADSWDTAMREAVDKGAPEAGQFIGRYTPLLQQRLFGAYAGGGGQGAAAPTGGTPVTGAPPAAQPADMLDRQYQSYTPQQLAQSLQRTNMFLGALSTVRDQQSYDRAINQLVQAGFPQAASLRGQYNPLQLTNLWNTAQQRALYLQNRVGASASGAPNPLVKTDMQVVDNVGYSPYTGRQMTPSTYKPVEGAFDAQGRPILYAAQGGGIAPAGGTPPAPGTVSIADAASRIQTRAENPGGNPAAVNPRSSALGNGQFIDSTWLSTFKSTFPDAAKGLTNQQILALRSDPGVSDRMTQALATDNATALGKAGMPVTTATLALAHRLGAGGAQKLLNAAPNTPLEQILPANVIAANPDMRGQTAGSYAQGLARQVGNDPVDAGTGPIFHKGQYDKPQLVEIDNGTGGVDRVLAQQNNITGQWVTADEKRAPINEKNMVIIPESMAAGGGRFAGQVMRLMVSAKQSTNEIGNLVELPLTASTGLFGGAQNAQPTSLYGATKQVLAQEVTPQDVQDFNTSMIGMGKALAGLESGGMQTNQALIEQFDKLALKEGDTNLTKMRKLATMRQDAEAAIEATLTSPMLGKAQKEFATGLLADMRKAVPWSPNDVTRLERTDKPGATLGDFAKSVGLSGPPQFVSGHTYTDAKGNNATYGGKDSSGKDIWTPAASK